MPVVSLVAEDGLQFVLPRLLEPRVVLQNLKGREMVEDIVIVFFLFSPVYLVHSTPSPSSVLTMRYIVPLLRPSLW